MKSPCFSNFRELLDRWDESAPSMKVRSLIDTNDLVIFMKKDGKIYGAPESGRVIFAKMKNPDEDLPDDWAKDASFTVFDLEQALKGRKVQAVICYKDLASLKIIDEDAAIKALAKIKSDEPAELDDKEEDNDDPQPSNSMKLGEK